MPRTQEFAKLAKNTPIGIYPTLWPLAAWQHGVCERSVRLDEKDRRALALYKNALRMYEDGAYGISTFNWYSHLRNGKMPYVRLPDGEASSGLGAEAVQTYIYPLLTSAAAVRQYRDQPWAVPQRGEA